MRDPYSVLNVPKGASEADIKKAFRKAAKQHHPDQNRNDPKAAERFAELNAAYEILGDKDKRAQFDRGEIGADGKPSGFRGFEGFGGAGPSGRGASSFAEDIFRQFSQGMGGGARRGPHPGATGGFDASDIFGRMFGETAERARGPQRRSTDKPRKGQDAEATMRLTLEEIVADQPKRIRVPTGKELEIAIPRTVKDGQTVRLRGQGHPAPSGGEPGDVMLTIRIEPHERFTLDGRDLRGRFSVSLQDAVLGGPVFVPTLSGGVEITLPPMTSGGKTFRLRGKGLPAPSGAGDLYATVEIVLPEGGDPELTDLMRRRRR